MSRHRQAVRRRSSQRRRTAPFAVLAALVVAVTVGGVGSAAYAWTRTAQTTATARAASLGVAITASNAVTGTYAWAGATSPVTVGTITMVNSGTADVVYTFSATSAANALANATVVWLWAPTAGTCGTTAPSTGLISAGRLPTASATLPASIATGTASRSATPALTTTLCVGTEIVDASNASLQGQTNTATFSVRGGVQSWGATASGTATQRVFRIGTAAPTCTNYNVLITLVPAGVVLTWNAVAGASSYLLWEQWAGGNRVAQTLSVPSATVTAQGGPTSTFMVEAVDSAYGTIPSAFPTVTSTRLNGNGVPRC